MKNIYINILVMKNAISVYLHVFIYLRISISNVDASVLFVAQDSTTDQSCFRLL